MSDSSDKTAGSPTKQPQDASLLDSTRSESTETTKNPSVHQKELEGETTLSNLDNVELSDKEKRVRTLSQKAIINTAQTQHIELAKITKTLQTTADSVYAAISERKSTDEIEIVLDPLRRAYTKYLALLDDMEGLSKQDKWGETSTQIQETFASHRPLTQYVSVAIDKAKNMSARTVRDTSSLSSRYTRRTGSSRSSASSSRARREALAEAAAVRKQAEFDQLIAEKESAKKKREAEEKYQHEQMSAQHELQMAILQAEKKKAIANAKLQAIEESILEEASGELSQIEPEDIKSRTQSWVDEQKPCHSYGESQNQDLPSLNKRYTETESPKQDPDVAPVQQTGHIESKGPQTVVLRGFAGNPPIFRPPPADNTATNKCLEGITTTSQQMVTTLARQNLPKCHPDVFSGDATLFHPWKDSFKAMVKDANLDPSQEIAYLRNYTKGKVQDLVDNFRKRRCNNPEFTCKELWTELERRFGNTALLTNALLDRLRESARFSARDKDKLQIFADICADVDNQMTYLPGLSCLNYPTAIKPIVDSLPSFLRFKWEKEIVEYAEEHEEQYPTFHCFSTTIQKQARMKNHPNVVAGSEQPTQDAYPSGKKDKVRHTRTFKSKAERVGRETEDSHGVKYCLFHERKGHELVECKAFDEKTLDEKMDWIKKSGLCFRCLAGKHRAKECKQEVRSDICESNRHPTTLHKEKARTANKEKLEGSNTEDLQSRCTSVCRGETGGVSCSKILLVDIYVERRPETTHRVYAIIDDQSNASMISPGLIEKLNINGPKEKYLLTTCGGAKETKYGRRISGLSVKSTNGTIAQLPSLIECEHIPQAKNEIPTPASTKHYSHLKEISGEIPPLDHQAKVEVLIGRDAPELLKVRAFKNGPKGAPWAQKLKLGWTVSGQMCLDRVGGPIHISARRTTTEAEPTISSIEAQRYPTRETRKALESDSELEAVPCPNYFEVEERIEGGNKESKHDIYETTPEDNETSLSWEDRQFIKIMEKGIHKNKLGNWEMPLPFRSDKTMMPDNREQAVRRLQSLVRSFKRRPQMEKDYFEFLGKVIKNGHAELVQQEDISKTHENPSQNTRDGGNSGKRNVWYIPHFGIYHPKKPNQIRVVFDSSCEYQGVSLNKVLLPGPDLTNSLVGVLLRFRQEAVGVACDVEQMFHSFHVNPDHRDFLRFLWYKDNNPSERIVDYRMTVHLFGNSPSPAFATFGMRKAADDGEEPHGADVKKFICKDFYVDDGLTSQPSVKEVVSLVKRAQATLATANLRLHKVASNSPAVMEEFSEKDRAKDIRDLDLRRDVLPAQRTLGVQWNLQQDTLTYTVSPPEKPFTRRGVLSVINSIYDPLGLVAPVILVGKLLLQFLVHCGRKKQNHKPLRWDDPLPEDVKLRWQCWREELPSLRDVCVNRCYHPKNFGHVARIEIHAFSDASKDAIGAAVYLKQANDKGEVSVSLAFGQSKVAPTQQTSIPRLELCAAVLVTRAVQKTKRELDIEIDGVTFYTDSKVVLGYIKNDARRFHVYVANRVQAIRDHSMPSQWKYVDTSKNPADLATRGTTIKAILRSDWFDGPPFLKESAAPTPPAPEDDAYVDNEDPEVRDDVKACRVGLEQTTTIGSKRFESFSEWPTLQRALTKLILRARRCRQPKASRPIQETGRNKNPALDATKQATNLIIRTVQSEAFAIEINTLKKRSDSEPENQKSMLERRKLLQKSNLYHLDPFVDQEGILRIGGRLHRADLSYEERHPIILPKKHHVSEMIIRYYHQKVHHQGRLATHGAVRQAGYWIVGGHRLVSKTLNSCVICKRLRGKSPTQHMADLPADRIEQTPPFTNVGLDVFGPWIIKTKKLRGGALESKRWGLVFTCLTSRAIHIEVLQSMDAISFINALRRFFSIRGPAALLRCDCGTNFTGAKSELERALNEMDRTKIERYVKEQECQWKFNPPHSSHFGGVWERQIGTIRRILDSMLRNIGSSQLDHELLTTLMAEVTGIINSRPITAISSDIERPYPLTPSMLLNMKQRPLTQPPGKFVKEDLYARRYWRRAQYLADQFWLRWRQEYLQNLQVRKKWCDREKNISLGDIVLVKDNDVPRNEWPMGRATEALKSEDGKVRKAKILISKDGKPKTVLRPICELIQLLDNKDSVSLDEECEVA